MGLDRFDQAVQVAAGPGAFDGIGKQPVVATDHEGADGSFGGVIVNFEPTVFAVANQLVPLIVQVVKRLASQAGGRHLRQRFIQPGSDFIEQRHGLLLAFLVAFLGLQILDLFFDAV